MLRLQTQHQQLLKVSLLEVLHAKESHLLGKKIRRDKLVELRYRITGVNGFIDRLGQSLSENHAIAVYKQIHSNLAWAYEHRGSYVFNNDIPQALQVCELIQRGEKYYYSMFSNKGKTSPAHTIPLSPINYIHPLIGIIHPKSQQLLSDTKEYYKNSVTNWPQDLELLEVLQIIIEHTNSIGSMEFIETRQIVLSELGYVK